MPGKLTGSIGWQQGKGGVEMGESFALRVRRWVARDRERSSSDQGETVRMMRMECGCSGQEKEKVGAKLFWDLLPAACCLLECSRSVLNCARGSLLPRLVRNVVQPGNRAGS